MIESLQVSLGNRSYPIYFGGQLAVAAGDAVDAFIAAGRKVVIITDETVAAAQAKALAEIVGGAKIQVIPAGETAKSSAQLVAIWDFLAAEKMDRGGVVVAFGGGVVGDLVGFAAASYLRGVDFVQIPTTLLAMVDSSVGGKTGINLSAGKNLVGAFHQPQSVYVMTDLLRTLPAREFAAGMAEVIKYGLLGDADLFEQLVAAPLRADNPDLASVVRRCCEAKARIVEDDEFETASTGGRALLNLGHTFGHAIEKVAGYSVYLHGEAVAIGLAAAARLSRDLHLITAAEVGRIESVLAAHGLPTQLREPTGMAALMNAMSSDKKVRAGRLRFVVIAAIGEAATRDDIKAETVESVWREVGAA
jgi:3-dehydroquinate synthase